MKRIPNNLSSIFRALLPFVFLGLMQFSLAQETQKDTSAQNQTRQISFGTVPHTAQKSLEPFYEVLKTVEYGTQRFSVFDQLAEHHIKRGNTDSILHYGNQYVKEVRNWDKPESDKKYYSTRAQYIMGVGNAFNGLLDKSIEWHIKGIQDSEVAAANEYEYKNKVGLANAYLLKSSQDKAIPILEEALKDYSPEFTKITNEALVLMGNAYLAKDDYLRAGKYYDQALDMAIDFKNREMELTVKLRQARLVETMNDIGKAFTDYETIREQAKSEGFNAIYFEGSLLLAKLYYKEELYETANIALSFAYINAVDRANLQFQKEALILQARCFSELGDYKNSYAVMTQLFGVANEINSKQQRAIIKELEVQYETLEKEKAITSLEEDQILKAAELKRQKTVKNAFLIGFLIILIPIFALLYVYYQKIQAQSQLSLQQKELNDQKVTALKQEQELNLIKASIEGQDEERKRIAQELHDSIGGNLAGIKLQMASLNGDDSKKYKGIADQLDETYQLVRDISHTLIPKKFKQNAFTDLISEYARSMVSSGQLEVGFHPHPEEEINKVDEKIQMELFKIIQELMTNTLKHAEAQKVDIHLSLINEELSLLFEDDGKGFEVSGQSEGIGFKNIKNRIDELSGKLHVDSNKNRGTIVSLEIPIKIKEDEI